jgi:hypothetical protein
MIIRQIITVYNELGIQFWPTSSHRHRLELKRTGVVSKPKVEPATLSSQREARSELAACSGLLDLRTHSLGASNLHLSNPYFVSNLYLS